MGAKAGGESPIHDRWWLTKDSGIRIGTSINSLGITRISEISYLTREEAAEREQLIKRYLNKVEREHRGERLLYTSFTL